ncbi:MAG: efflux RND transporter periplasmic adaptor subunit [Acidobacteria bacterium]|nr:efflux RND transporter periplasmic adaptor subunit [Acidobacteriota bacterium]
MRKALVGLIVVAALGGGAWWYLSRGTEAGATAPASGGAAAGGRGGAAGGRGRGASIAVETAVASRHAITDYITVVGNLIGETTVDVVPRVAGRLESVPVKLGDRVTKGQLIAKVEDRELREQVNQSEANIEVNKATVTARENDLKVAQNVLDRAVTSYERGLVSKQQLEDAEARYNSAASQVTVAKAQLSSTQARLDELKINLANTNLLSPMDGAISRRNLDPGAFAGINTVVVSLVDIGTVRLIANLVEKDFKRVLQGAQAVVEVDAFPGEQFTGRVSRVAPVFDPATRTATMEIEIPNPGFRLRPGMYARVRLVADHKQDALTVPRNAVVDIDGRRGVFLIGEGNVAKFQPVTSGLSDGERVEILEGLGDGTRIITAGALALRNGDRITLIGNEGRGRGGRNGRAGGAENGAAAAPPAATAGDVQPTGTSGADGSRRGGRGSGRRGDAGANAQ